MSIPETVGPYRIDGALGSGGMGQVYRGHHRRLDRSVALKRIHPERADDPEARARFLREARIAARLHHPALVSVHDILEQDGTLWLVMELVEGEPLGRWLEGGPPPLDVGLRLALDIASGLAAIHDGGILHRDLDSKNVVVVEGEPGPRARLLDFGLAKPLDESDASLTGTGTGGLMGTPRAMSPEQARGETIDARSDLFALGSLLYELFTGVSPFLAESAVETLARVAHHDPEPLRRRRPELPEALDRWIGRLLAKDPADRPRSAHEVVAAIDGLLRMAGAAGIPGETGSMSGGGFELPGEAAGAAAGGPRGERRQLTVVCAELIGRVDDPEDSSGSLDPETLVEVLPPFRARLHRVLDRYSGYLGDFGGHRIGLYFGWPQAREDAALRAVAAALELASLGDELRDPRPSAAGLAVRVGVHAGPVAVLTTADARERLVLGETWDRAVELRGSAGAGEVWISPSVGQRIEGHFAGEPGADGARGPSRVTAWEGQPDPTRLQSPDRPSEWLSEPPIVGRERELDLLLGRLRQAAEGLGQAVSITAEAGVGKTRLLRALRSEASTAAADGAGGPGPVFWSVRGTSFRSREPLAALVELIRRILGLDSPGADAGPLAEPWNERLMDALEAHDLPSEELLPTLGPWLGAHAPSLDAPGIEDRETARLWPELLLELVEQRFEAGGPTVLIFEDLQWLDPATLAVLGALLERCAGSPLLLLVSSRPEFQSPWASARNLTHLRLDPLDAARSLELLDQLDPPGPTLEAHPLEDRARQALVERSGGVPFYLRELVRAARGETACFPGSEVPGTLFDGLAARLDRMGTARELARIAALFPGDFSDSALRRLRLFDPTRLEHEIGRLLDGRVWLPVRDGPGDRVHRFAHPLLREVALASLPSDDRARLEARIETIRTVG